MWEKFKPFSAVKHQTWKWNQPFLAGNIYSSANSLDRKIDDTVTAIALLDAATASGRKIYSNITTNVTSLTAKIYSENKNLVAALWDNARLERLLGKCKLRGYTRKKLGQEEPSHSLTTAGCVGMTLYTQLQVQDKNTGCVTNSKITNMQGGSKKNNLEWSRIVQ